MTHYSLHDLLTVNIVHNLILIPRKRRRWIMCHRKERTA